MLFCPAEDDTKHCGSHDKVQGGHALGCVWTALSFAMGKPGLTQATLKQENLSKHLSLTVHPVAQIMWPQCSAELGLYI